MWTKSRRLSGVVAASYVLALATAALVHNHTGCDSGCCGGHGGAHGLADNHGPGGRHGGHEDGQPAPGAPGRHATQDDNCPACQFLAQKPAPTAVVAPVAAAALVEEVAFLAPARPAAGVFSAWQSRAPPALA